MPPRDGPLPVALLAGRCQHSGGEPDHLSRCDAVVYVADRLALLRDRPGEGVAARGLGGPAEQTARGLRDTEEPPALRDTDQLAFRPFVGSLGWPGDRRASEGDGC